MGKRMHRSFLRHCAEGDDLSAEADSILKEGTMDEPSTFNVEAEMKELMGMLEPGESPAIALKRCRPPRGWKRKSIEQQSLEEIKFARLTEVCDALVSHGVHDVYQCKREELDRCTEKAAITTEYSADAGPWWYRWTVGEQNSEVFGPFETKMIASWMRSS